MKKLFEISLISSMVLIIGVQTVFSACGSSEDGSFMNCHNAQMTVFYLGIALAVLSFAGIFLEKAVGRTFISIVSALLAVIAAVVPGGIVSMCMMETMRCYIFMKPFTIVMCILILTLSAANLIACLRVGNKNVRK